MKHLAGLVVSGISGGLIVLLGFFLMDQEAPQQPEPQARQINQFEFTKDAPNNFIAAANTAMPAVVHINAIESVALAQDRYNQKSRRDPFSFFFGGDSFFNGPRARSGKGSGVIISEEGFIVTNNHVIEFADEFEVTLYDNRKFKAKLVGSDPRTDLAVIKIDSDNLPYLKFGDSDEVTVGEWVLAVGNPFDLTSTVTAGIVSAKGRDNIIKRNDAIEDFIQTDAVVNPGNSGGALVNTEGQLIGINTAIATATGYYAGYSFAIPVNMFRPIIENLIEHGGPRPRLGVSIATLADYEEYAEVVLPAEEGVVVTRVEDGSAAQYAGIIPNDVVIAIDDVKVHDPEGLIAQMNTKSIGDEILITINRDGQTQDIAVRLKAE